MGKSGRGHGSEREHVGCLSHVTQAPPTSQREQNINRKAILGPDHLTVRELRQQWEWNTWPHASCERKEGGRERVREEGGRDGKGQDGVERSSQNHSRSFS